MFAFFKPVSWFLGACRFSLISLLLLILAGGIVRSSGSGMGCPDWPKCFNRIIPPTKASELPPNYEAGYLAKRVMKNNRLAALLNKLGYKELAGKVKNDPKIWEVEEFNAFNTWTEYINRLIGVLTGFGFLAVWLLSFFIRAHSKLVFWLSGLNLILIFFQAYLGSLVVSTHLLPGIISLHMLLAIIIVFFLLFIYHKALKWRPDYKPPVSENKSSFIISSFIWISPILSSLQILLGTNVRESFDHTEFKVQNSIDFMRFAGNLFPLHRDLSIGIFLLNMGIAIWVIKNIQFISLRRQVIWTLGTIFCQIALGLSLEWGNLPPVSQALHVFLAVVLISSQVWTLLIWRSIKPIRDISY